MRTSEFINKIIGWEDEAGIKAIQLKYSVEAQKEDLETMKLALLDDPDLKDKGITNDTKRKGYLNTQLGEEMKDIRKTAINRDIAEHNGKILKARREMLMAIMETEGDNEIPEDFIVSPEPVNQNGEE